jgi:CubicO group peptidase (beta-lactamase class C family)
MKILGCVCLIALCPSPVLAQRPPALDTAALSAYVASVAKAGQIPDVAVVVVGPEGPVYQARLGPEGFGEGPIAGERGDAHDRFYLGSVSESLTAFAVMRLVDDGLIDLDAPVVRYLPELAFSDPGRTDRLTVRHLLERRSGLPKIGFFNRRVRLQGRLDHIDFVREPGEHFEASGLDYLVLGRVLEAASGESYAAHMAERVFEPTGMGSVSADWETARREGVVQGHRYLFGWPIATDGHTYSDDMVPAAHVAASAPDVGRFLSVLLSRGSRDGTRLLSASGVEALLPPATDQAAATVQDNFDYGWKSVGGGELRAWYREGVSPGFHALIAVLPEQGLGIVILASRAGGPGPNATSELLRGVTERALGRAGRAYVPWERILHLALLILVVAGILLPFHWHRRWKAMGRPTATAHTVPIVSRLALELALAVTLPLVVVLGVEKMSILGLLSLHPDLGIAVIVFPFAIIPTTVWKTLVHSEQWRRSRETPPPVV